MSTPSPRLSIFLPGLYGGGAERTMLNVGSGFAARGYSVDLVLAQAVGPYLQQVPTSMRLIDLGASRSLTSLPSLVRYLRREQPAVLLSALNRANLLAIWARALARVSTRIVISERNTLSIDGARADNLRSRLSPLLARLFYRHADQIISVSNGVADDLCTVAGLPAESIRTIYNPVVTPELRKRVDAPFEHPWFGPDMPPVVVAIGRLSEQKDFPTLINAFHVVRKQHNARLLILGEGAERSHIETLIQQLDLTEDVALPGWVENPYPYIKRAALFVLSSKWEGLPGVLIEALYCGVPLIATDCPSGPREILAGGTYGTLVPVGDVARMADAMSETLTTPPPPLPQESWQRFEMNRVVDQYLDALLPLSIQTQS